tara:strand:- start:2813 stop:4579 length:1767 start_codon:yes stop_codon:yes gene_type:complete
MNEFLQQRIQNMMEPASPMGFQEGGMVEDPLTEEESMEYNAAMQEPVDRDADLRQAIEELMVARDTAEDPFEKRKAEQLIEAAQISQTAPLADAALQVSQAGRGGDTTLAHVTPGEVVLPAEMMEDPQFESAVETRFKEVGLNPEEYVVGLGIASLNPQTGLEEFFLKKIAKFGKKLFKKVVRPVAKVAQFVPGPWQAPAALISKADTVYKVAKGEASPLALATLATGPKIFGETGAIANIAKAGGESGNFLSGLGSLLRQTPGALQDTLTNLPGNIASGIGSLITKPSETIQSILSGAGLPGGQGVFGADPLDAMDTLEQLAQSDAGLKEQIESALGQGKTPADIMNQLSSAMPGQQGGDQNILQRIGGALGIGSEEGQVPFGRALGIGGIGALLAKLAFDEAKNRRGVPLTPLTQETATGRYNIEAEIARRMGKEAPNPVEFGLLPTGTIPKLTAGRQAPQRNVPQALPTDVAGIAAPPRLMMGGGMVMPMAYAKGGNVAAEEFKRMNGEIDGPGTETSDDIPAMLSDGEFVMKSQAVRGAGAFDMTKKKGGIVELRPTREEDRERGTKLMYDMMDLFAGKAKASA